MQDDKPKLPPVFTEIIGAIVIHETRDARKFMLGRMECWTPKAASKLIDTRLYVERPFAIRKVNTWCGAFIEGSQRTRMRAMDDAPIKVIEDTIIEMQKQLNNMWRALQIYKKTRDDTSKQNTQEC